jgi:filamentous hemagglutinin
MLVSGVGAAYLEKMFQWAGFPAAGTGAGWLTPAGVVLRANAAVTGSVANKATQAYLDSRNR